ncbi:hypothetical protein FRC08_003832 [Ceratobasidium sp. 394]|nr:hypothetical protein FRC08_003832 [Ceratobasidium sp. 394]
MLDRCPRMETLQMFPEESSDDFSLRYAELAKMRHLRSFTWSGHRVDQGLMGALGALPQLESLRFLFNIAETPNYYSDLSDSEDEHDPRYDIASDPIAVSESSFPALRSLDLHNLGPQTIARVCALGPLFRGLTKLKISYETYSSPYWRDGRTWSEDVFASLGDGSPHLSDLEISNRSSLELTTKVIERLGRMPLRRLSLPGVWITDKVGWNKFVEVLPNLEELELGAGPGFQWLWVFAARLINLRLLCFGTLNFAEMDKTKEVVNWQRQSGLYHQAIIIRTDFRLRFPMERQVDEVARYIYDIWPNAQCEPYSLGSDSVDRKAARLLNAKLDVLRLEQA